MVGTLRCTGNRAIVGNRIARRELMTGSSKTAPFSLDLLPLFVRIIEGGGLTLAAKELGISTSTASRRLSALEENLGTVLVRRSTRSFSPTAEGMLFYTQCKALLGALDQARDALHRDPRGSVVVTAPPSLERSCFVPLLADFSAVHPEIDIRFLAHQAKLPLVDSLVDLAFRVGRPPTSSLVAKRLCSYYHRLVASRDYIEKHGSPQEPDDLGRHPLVAFDLGAAPSRWNLHRPPGKPVSLSIRARMSFNSYEAVDEALCRGLGIGEMPEMLVAARLQRGEFVEVLPAWRYSPFAIDTEREPASVDLYLVSEAPKGLNAAVTTLRNFASDYLPRLFDAGW